MHCQKKKKITLVFFIIFSVLTYYKKAVVHISVKLVAVRKFMKNNVDNLRSVSLHGDVGVTQNVLCVSNHSVPHTLLISPVILIFSV